MSDFNLAIQTVLGHEGGYVNNPKDPGGETKFGISKRSYPKIDIKNLTLEQAKEIYKKDWWDKYNYGALVDQTLATKVFDAAVNMGAKKAHQLLQQAVQACGAEIKIDGVLGVASFAIIAKISHDWLLDRYRIELAGYYAALVQRDKKRIVFLLGWIERALS